MSFPENPQGSLAGTGGRKDRAYRLIILFGIVAMLGDVVYEGGRSVAGPFLFTLGASAFAVAFIAGFGEFAGYAIRIATGYLADRSRQYWTFVIAGYAMIAAIPLLVLAGSWEVAAILLIVERIGKAVRSPAKDAVLSHATAAVGRGWGSPYQMMPLALSRLPQRTVCSWASCGTAGDRSCPFRRIRRVPLTEQVAGRIVPTA
jgi:hypothetical protein